MTNETRAPITAHAAGDTIRDIITIAVEHGDTVAVEAVARYLGFRADHARNAIQTRAWEDLAVELGMLDDDGLHDFRRDADLPNPNRRGVR